MHVNVPNAHSLHRLLAVEIGLIEDPFELSSTQKQMQQHSTFGLDSLAELLCQQGFEVQSSGGYFINSPIRRCRTCATVVSSPGLTWRDCSA